MTILFILAIAALLFACGGWFVRVNRQVKGRRPERLTIDHKLVTTNERMKGIGVR